MFKIGIVGAEEGARGINVLKFFIDKQIKNAEICFVVSRRGFGYKNLIVEILNDFSKKSFYRWCRFAAGRTLELLKAKIMFLIGKKCIDDESLIKIAEKAGIDVFCFDEQLRKRDHYNSMETIDFMERRKPDVILISHVGLIKGDLLRVSRLGIINIHPGILPKYRGLRPVYWQLYNVDPVGTTVHFVDEGIDTGPILMTGSIDINETDTLGTINIKQSDLGVELFYKTLEGLIEQRIVPRPQKKEDGIHWKLADLTKDVKKKARANIKNYKKSVASS